MHVCMGSVSASLRSVQNRRPPDVVHPVLRFILVEFIKRKRSRPRGPKSSSFHYGLSHNRHPQDVVGRFAPVGALPRSTGPRAPRLALLPAGSVSPRTNVPRTLCVLACRLGQSQNQRPPDVVGRLALTNLGVILTVDFSASVSALFRTGFVSNTLLTHFSAILYLLCVIAHIRRIL